MRAVVLDSEDLVFGRAEDGDLALRRLHAARAAQRDVVDVADCDPVRFHIRHSAASEYPTVAIGRNSCLSLPETRSDQGSTWANFWEKTKRS